jgi:hypothetical protein
MASTLDLMKQWAISGGNLSNESPLANQFMNVLSQQQAQKARENQMMQQFLMERRMKEEDFQRKVEFAKMFKKQNNEEMQNVEKAMKFFKDSEKELLMKHNNYLTVKSSMEELNEKTKDNQVGFNAFKKVSKAIDSFDKLDSLVSQYIKGRPIKDAADFKQLIPIISQKVNLTADESSEFSSIMANVFDEITRSTKAVHGRAPGQQIMMQTTKEKLRSVFDKNNYKEYSPDWNQKAFRVQFEDVILHDRVRKNIANYEYNRYKNSPLSHIQQNKDLSLAGSILAESPIEVQEDTDTSLEKAMESGEPVFTASEQKVYDEILRRGGTEEDALRTIEKYRGAK